jgi:adenine-specific DNA glycosylase
VANRIGLAPGRNVDEVERKLLKLVPEEYRKDAHHWLILHGRYVCKARKPDCPECPIADLCEYRAKTPPPAREATGRSSILPGRASRGPANDKAGARPARSRKPSKLST